MGLRRRSEPTDVLRSAATAVLTAAERLPRAEGEGYQKDY
jgi:hypothetical protein